MRVVKRQRFQACKCTHMQAHISVHMQAAKEGCRAAALPNLCVYVRGGLQAQISACMQAPNKCCVAGTFPSMQKQGQQVDSGWTTGTNDSGLVMSNIQQHMTTALWEPHLKAGAPATRSGVRLQLSCNCSRV